MTSIETEPILDHWFTAELPRADWSAATVADATRRLALLDVDDIDARVGPLLAAAAAEVALATGIPWPCSSDDPPVALLRLMAKVAVRNPTAGGPHTARLIDRLS